MSVQWGAPNVRFIALHLGRTGSPGRRDRRSGASTPRWPRQRTRAAEKAPCEEMQQSYYIDICIVYVIVLNLLTIMYCNVTNELLICYRDIRVYLSHYRWLCNPHPAKWPALSSAFNRYKLKGGRPGQFFHQFCG